MLYICGYAKCTASLALHHIESKKKDFSFGRIRANPQSWQIIVKELRKCILVCHNCHCEIHADIIVPPVGAPKFNEELSDYKNFAEQSKIIMTPCLICGKLKSPNLKHCSRKCSGRSKYRVVWDNLDILTELKTKSIVKLAEELGCSDGAIHKRMKKLGLK